MASVQTWIAALPQVVVALLAGRGLFCAPAWNAAGISLTRRTRGLPLRILACVLALAAVGGGVWWLLQPPAAPRHVGAVAGTEAWPTIGGGPSRDGTVDADTGPVPGDLHWRFRDALILERRPFMSSPAIAGGRVLIGSDNFKLYCLDLDTGRQLWAFEARWPIFSSPVVSDGRVYVGEGLHEQEDSKLYCLSLADGKVLWEKQTQSHTESTPTVVDGKVYFGAGEDGLYCCDASTGAPIWQFSEPHADGCPLVVEGRVFIGSGYGFNGIYCLDAATGRPVWKRQMPASVWGAPSWADGRLYVGIGNGNFVESAEKPYGEVRCLDAATGRDLWRFTDCRDGVLTSVALAGGLAVFGSRGGTLYALDAGTGELRWKASVDSPILSSPAIAGDRVCFGADDGKFRCVRLTDGAAVWEYDTSEDLFLTAMDARIQSSPAAAPGKVVFGSANGNVYCLGVRAQGRPAAAAQHGSRLMRGADVILTAFVNALAGLTGSAGAALVLAALAFKALLFPVDRMQRRQVATLRALVPRIQALWRESADEAVVFPRIRELYARERVRPLVVLTAGLAACAAFFVLILVVQSSTVFERKGFLWLSDLSAPEQAGWLSGACGPLTLAFAVSLWLYLTTLLDPARRREPAPLIGLLVASGGISWLVRSWPAVSLLFAAAVFLFDVLGHVFRAALQRVRSRGPPGRPSRGS